MNAPMTRISRGAPTCTGELDFYDSAEESFAAQGAPNELDVLPQGLVTLVQQLMPQQVLLAMRLGRAATQSAERIRPGVEPSHEQEPRTARDAERATSPTPMSLHSAGVAPEERSLPLAYADSGLQRLAQPSDDDPLRVTPTPPDDGFEQFVARSARAAVVAQTQTQTQPQARTAAQRHQSVAPTVAAQPPGASDDYLRLPFNHAGVSAVVTVSRHPGEWTAPLQLSSSHAQITAHLARQLEHAPQPGWAMVQDQSSEAGDEQRKRQHSQDSAREQPDERAGAPMPEDERG